MYCMQFILYELQSHSEETLYTENYALDDFCVLNFDFITFIVYFLQIICGIYCIDDLSMMYNGILYSAVHLYHYINILV